MSSRDVLRGKESFAVCLRGTGEAGEAAGTLVGAVALTDAAASTHAAAADERELGYWTGRPFWGRGYMPEAARRPSSAMRVARGACGDGLARVLCGKTARPRAWRRAWAFAMCAATEVSTYPFWARCATRPSCGSISPLRRLRRSSPRRVRELLAGDPEPARFLSITEPVKLGRVTVLAVGDDLGALVRFKRNGAYFAAPVDGCAARIMASMVPDGALVSLCDERYLEVLRPRCRL